MHRATGGACLWGETEVPGRWVRPSLRNRTRGQGIGPDITAPGDPLITAPTLTRMKKLLILVVLVALAAVAAKKVRTV